MAKSAELEKLTGIARRFGAFVAERHPFALADALEAFEAATGGREPRNEGAIESARAALRRELSKRLQASPVPESLTEPTPRVTAAERLRQAHAELVEECGGFPRRAAIEASLTAAERIENRDIQSEFAKLNKGDVSALQQPDQFQRATLRLKEITALLAGTHLKPTLLKPDEVSALARSLETHRTVSQA